MAAIAGGITTAASPMRICAPTTGATPSTRTMTTAPIPITIAAMAIASRFGRIQSTSAPAGVCAATVA
jgi:hypothetical protein